MCGKNIKREMTIRNTGVLSWMGDSGDREKMVAGRQIRSNIF